MFVAALFIITKRYKQPKCPLTQDWINKMWSIHKMEYYSVYKRKEILTLATTRMNPEDVMLSEISQIRKDKYCVIPYMRSLQESDRCIETESRWWVPGAGEGGGEASV